MEHEQQGIPTIQRVISIFWPSFLTAGLTTIIVFTVFDPHEVFSCIGGPEINRLGAYTIGFFFFWVVNSVACAMSMYFCKPCHQVSSARAER